jgi:hypothetical protein
MRRVIAIETDLLRIQAEILHQRQNGFVPADGIDRDLGGQLGTDNGPEDRCDPLDDRHERAASTPRTLTYCFLRLGNLDNAAFQRLGRYNAALWRQTAQSLFLLQRSRDHCGAASLENAAP